MEKIIGLQKRGEQEFIALLESVPFEEAREKILKHDFGFSFEHPHHQLGMQWLHLKESRLQERIASRTLLFARHAAYSAYAAAIIAVISIIVTIMLQ